MLFSITMIHAGLASAVFAFLLWSLPGAVGMYALSLGVQKMPDRLPSIVYALLSGMNASTVGIIALAAVQVRSSFHPDDRYILKILINSTVGRKSDTGQAHQNSRHCSSMCRDML
jgi:chromate transport protein ChrA